MFNKAGIRRIFFDTETTGTSVRDGHKIIEIGCIETIDFKKTGKTLQIYLNPEREIDEGATRVHGKTWEMLKNEKIFREVHLDFLEFVKEDEIIAHNAGFDLSFINYELSLIGQRMLANEITDSLTIARKHFPGQPASLDALCKKFKVDNSGRGFHGALLDADLLCDVFTEMLSFIETTKGLPAGFDYRIKKESAGTVKRNTNFAFRKFEVSEAELEKHKEFLKSIGF